MAMKRLKGVKMKRIFLLVAVVSFLFLFSFVNIHFAYGEASLSITSKAANPESKVSVPIVLSNNDSIVSLQFDVVFNNLDLEVSNSSKPAEPGNALKGTNFSISSKLVEPGRVRVIITPPLQSPLPLIPDGTIVIISMKVKQNISGSKETINFDKVSTSDANGDSEPLAINKGTITIQTSTTPQIKNFSDLSPTDWFYTYVEDIAKAGITTGYPDGTYRPNELVTRAQMAAFLARALKLNIPDECNSSPFYDVDTNTWFCPYVEAIKSEGVTTGYPDGSYGPNDYVTRAQMAAFLVKALHLNTQPCTSQPFSDVPTDVWYCPYVQAIKNAGITSGYPDGTYRPDAVVTRAIMAAFIDKAFLRGAFSTTATTSNNSSSTVAVSQSKIITATVEASIVQGATVCVVGTNNCGTTNSNGEVTLNVSSLPVNLSVQVGGLVLGTVEDNQSKITITPLTLAQNDVFTAMKIGAVIHAIAGDVNDNQTRVDLRGHKVSGLAGSTLISILRKGKSVVLHVDGTHTLKVGGVVQFDNKSVTYYLVHNPSTFEQTVQTNWSKYLHSAGYPSESLDQIVKQYPCHIQVNMDNTLPASEQQYVLPYHNKLCSVLRYLTGFDPYVSFDMSYDPSMHRSWNPNMTHLYADKLPSKDPYFKSWYSVELAHLFIADRGVQSGVGDDELYLRPLETLSQTITSVVAYYYGKELGFSREEYDSYAQQLKPDYYYAIDNFIRNVDTFIIYQTDVDYAMDADTLFASAHQILELFLADPKFFRNLIGGMKGWSSAEDLEQAFIDSVTTLPSDIVSTYVSNMPYFKQVNQSIRPKREIAIVPFSAYDVSMEDHFMRYGYCHIDGAYVLGQSYDSSNLGLPSWDIVPDPNFYGQPATLEVENLTTGSSFYAKTKILSNLQNGGMVLFYLKPGNIYKLIATSTVDNVTYTATYSFIQDTCLRSDKQVVTVNEPITLRVVGASFNRYSWDFNGDGVVDKVTDTNSVTCSYSQPGIYNPRVEISYNDGSFTLKMPAVIVRK